MAIPKKAKKVFSGVIFDVYQWQQKMFDGSHATFERIKRQDSVVVIATKGKKILLEKEIQPAMSEAVIGFVTGRLDKAGESPRNTALRELMEETGLKPHKLKLYKTFYVDEKVTYSVHVFIAQECVVAGKPTLDNGERIEHIYVNFNDLLKTTDNPKWSCFPQITELLLRARIDKKHKANLYKKIFSS